MNYRTGVILVIAAAVLWSLQGLMFRQIGTPAPWAILFWRSVGMVPVLAAFLLWRGGLGAAVGSVGVGGVLGGLGLVGAFAGAIYAMGATTIANAVFLFAASPFLTAFFAWLLLGERVSARTWVAMALAAAGVYVMVSGGIEAGRAAGNVAALLSALGFAVFTVSLRWRRVSDTLPTVLLGSLFSVTAACAVSGVIGSTLVLPLPDMLWAMSIGGVTLTGGLVLYTLGSRAVMAADLALISMIEVMLAPLWVWVFLGEETSRNTLAGGAILLLAVAFNALAGVRRRPAPTGAA